jgi:hypothetical protein
VCFKLVEFLEIVWLLQEHLKLRCEAQSFTARIVEADRQRTLSITEHVNLTLVPHSDSQSSLCVPFGAFLQASLLNTQCVVIAYSNRRSLIMVVCPCRQGAFNTINSFRALENANFSIGLEVRVSLSVVYNCINRTNQTAIKASVLSLFLVALIFHRILLIVYLR